jgi:hypothetical protein
MEKFMFFVRFKTVSLAVALFLTSFVSAQETVKTPVTPPKKVEKKSQNADITKNATAEQVAESSILIYGFPGGRQLLNQIRKTTIERGKISVTNAEGKTEQVNYQRWILRAEKLEKEKNRFEQDFPNAKYSLIYDGEKVFGIYNDSVFAPREDAAKTFQNQIYHGLESLLRYKENESKIELGGREKMSGVDYYFLDVTDKQNRKTRFYVSTKTFRVMMLDYESDGVKYRRKFYNYNYAQGTLVPYRSILLANDKKVEETEVGTITYGQKVDDAMFKES